MIPRGARALAFAGAVLVSAAFLGEAPALAGEDVLPADSTVAIPPVVLDASFPVALGSFSTTLTGSRPSRTENIRLAAKALDGAVLAPGENLSFNDRVGPRSRERGYQTAPVILRETRQTQVGGGICQVSSTVFVAALLSGLSVPERFRHSTPVDYIPLGQDATIAWGVKDLRIRNDLDRPVRLRVEIVGSTLSARFEGEEETETTFELDVVEQDLPDASGETGGAPGREIEVFRIRRVDGQNVDREFLHRDTYPPSRPR